MNLITKIEERLLENKSGTKTYKTYESAENVGSKLSLEYAEFNSVTHDSVGYIVVYLPNVGRYTVVFQMMAFWTKHRIGGYVGWFAERGFFTI